MKIKALLAALLCLAFSGSMANAATSVPYQRSDIGNCGLVLTCTIDFPVVPAGKRLEITNTSCYVFTTFNSRFYALQLLVVTPGGVNLNAVTPSARFTDLDFDSNYRHYTANSKIFAFATGGQHFQAFAQLSAGTFRALVCHISGRLITP